MQTVRKIAEQSFYKKELSQNYSTAASARRGTTKARQSQVEPWPWHGTFLCVRAFHAGYLQTLPSSCFSAPISHLKFSSAPGSANFQAVSCHIEQSPMSVTRTQRCGIGLKLNFLNTQNWFLQAIFYISCQHLNATKAFSMSKQCHLENPFTLSLPAVVLHPFFVNILGNKFYLQGTTTESKY